MPADARHSICTTFELTLLQPTLSQRLTIPTPPFGTLRDRPGAGEVSPCVADERKIMANSKNGDSVLDASYEAVKVELENTERDVVKLRERTDKLRTAIDALAELLPSKN